jgi:hypothetical protein
MISMLCNIFVLRFRTIPNTPHFDLKIKMVFIKSEGISEDKGCQVLRLAQQE